MTWNKDKLRAVAVERGEAVPDDGTIGRLLLAHERMRGRTEEDYPRDIAGKELDAMLERQSAPLPQESGREYSGLKQLRTYAAGQALSRAVTHTLSNAKPERANSRFDVPVREREREQG